MVYDAWNSVVKVTDNSDAAIAEYRYDGRGCRIAKFILNVNNWDRTDYYYNESWQCLEERYGANQPMASEASICRRASRMASINVSSVRALTFRRYAFTFDQSCSMGFKSGLYGGRNHRSAPAA